MERQTIYIDIDDTLLQSSEEIIRQLNIKNGTNKTIEDLKDYGYRSIDKYITNQDILDMFGSQEFFDNVRFTNHALQAISILQKKYDIVFVSYGDNRNLNLKEKFITNLCLTLGWANVFFEGCFLNESKNKIKEMAYFAIDNHSGHLREYNAHKKILFKNNQNVTWNQCPVNDEWYIANTFLEILDIITYDNMISEEEQ